MILRHLNTIYFYFFIFNIVLKVSSDEICLDCLSKNVRTGKCTIPFCPTNSRCDAKFSDLKRYYNEIKEPILLCRDDYSLTFSWNQTENFYVFIQYVNAKTNATGISNFTICNRLTINGLESNTKYSIKIFGVSLTEKMYISKTIEADTLSSTKKLSPIISFNYKLGSTGHSYTATLHWKPSKDLPCIYEFVWHPKQKLAFPDHRKINIKQYGKREFNLTNLQFGNSYIVSILASVGTMESPKKSLSILVPTCLDTFKNLSVCPPNKPQNLSCNIEHVQIQINNSTFNQTNLKLTWNKPSLIPDYYNVSFISFNKTIKNNFSSIAKIPGDKNVVLLQNITTGLYHIVKLRAYSKGGASDPATMHFFYKTSSDSLNNATSFITIDKQNNKIATNWAWTIVTLILITIMLYLLRHKLKSISKNMNNTIIRYTKNEPENSKWELSESKLFIDKVIGVGAFGIVKKGCYYLEPNKKTEVAVKTLKTKPTVEQITQFYDEIEIMKAVPRHPHIVYLIGVITKYRPSNPLMLVEFCPYGDLQTFLRKMAFVLNDKIDECNLTKDCKNFFNKSYHMDTPIVVENKKYALESKDLLSFARQIVVGMEFLSTLKIIHRDLAARNILISYDNTLKISDFGLSRDIYADNIYRKVTGGKLPVRWMALESLTHQIYTTGSDVWSFGIVLWEIATLGENPYPTVQTEDLLILLKNGYRMEKPINCNDEIYKIMLNCWQPTPSLRPSFKDLREMFDKLLESETQYISLEDGIKLDFIRYENIKSEENILERYIVRNGNKF